MFLVGFFVFFSFPWELALGVENETLSLNPIVCLCLPNTLGKIRGGDSISASRRNLGYSQES